MVRTQTLPFNDYAVATSGQLTWIFLNTLVDYEERLEQIHVHCLPKFHRNVCEVCHEPIINLDDLPEEIRDKVYRPGEEAESFVKTITFDQRGRHTYVEEQEAEIPWEEGQTKPVE
jgi:hypothetical protein